MRQSITMVMQEINGKLSSAISKRMESVMKVASAVPPSENNVGSTPQKISGSEAMPKPQTGGTGNNDGIIRRKMKFPYTLSAKIAQFPWRYYYRSNAVYRYFFIAIVVCIPIFKSIENLSKSPNNVEKWAEIRRKEAHEHDVDY